MTRRLLLAYQLLTGGSDACTGVLLIFAPAFTLRLMGLHERTNTLPFLSFIGAFVLSVGIACFYGAWLTAHTESAGRLAVVWLLTAITRALVAMVVLRQIIGGSLELRWCTVAISDGAITLVQAIGLWKGWLADGAH